MDSHNAARDCRRYGHDWFQVATKHDAFGIVTETWQCNYCAVTKTKHGDLGTQYEYPPGTEPTEPAEPTPEEMSKMRSDLEEELRQLRS